MILLTLLITTIAVLSYLAKEKRRKAVKILKYGDIVKRDDPFCLYLRSFEDDATGDDVPENWALFNFKFNTYEEKVAKHLYGKLFVSVGRPGEVLPNLGAIKLYLEGAEWKQKISELISKASMIIVKPSNTAGLHWELEHIIQSDNLNKMVLFHIFNDFGERKLKEYYYNEFAETFKVNLDSNWFLLIHYRGIVFSMTKVSIK